MIKKQYMRNAAYKPEYLKQRATLECLLFQDANFADETDITVSSDILVRKKSYNAQEDNVFYGGCKYSVKINDIEVYAANCVNDDCDFFKLVKHSNGKRYLVFRRDLYGYSLLEIETLKDFHYYPVCSLGFIANEETFEETFIWTDVLYNPLNNLMAVSGCYWAGPYDLALVDFSEPFEPAENQVCISFKKDIGDILDNGYSWQKNTLVIKSKHSKWNKDCKPKKPEWDFVGIYADPGITGTSAKKRKEFQRMISDCMDGKIDLIIVKSVSRYARNVVDSLQHVRMLRDKGIKIYFEKEAIDSLDPKCDLILNIFSSLAEEESRSISTNIRWSVQKRFDKGEVIMNFKSLLGYSRDADGNVIIVPEQAEVVKDIYFQFVEGKSFSEIIDDLHARGIKTPMGKTTWTKSTIKSILENEKYVGDAILQKTYKRDFLDTRRVKNTGQAKQKYVENNHPAIIERAIFGAVKAELERRNNLRSVTESGKGRYNGKYAFSGMLVCMECGASYRRHDYCYRGKSEVVWTCKQHIESKHKCAQLPIKEKYLEDIFVRTLNGLLKNRSAILAGVQENVEAALMESGELNSATTADISAIDARIEELQALIMGLNKSRQRREIGVEQYNVQTQAAMNELDRLFVDRDGLMEQTGVMALNKVQHEQIAEFFANESMVLTFSKDVFVKLVETVFIKDRENITFEFKNGMTIKGVLPSGGEA